MLRGTAAITRFQLMKETGQREQHQHEQNGQERANQTEQEDVDGLGFRFRPGNTKQSTPRRDEPAYYCDQHEQLTNIFQRQHYRQGNDEQQAGDYGYAQRYFG